MHRILVDEKKWISDKSFVHALNYCMLLPGPEALQLAIYLGWLMHRTRGGLVAGGLFILPGIISLMALSVLYVLYGALPAVKAGFFGVKCAVIVIVVSAAVRLAKRLLDSRLKLATAFLSFVALLFFAAPFPAVIAGAGMVGYFHHLYLRQHGTLAKPFSDIFDGLETAPTLSNNSLISTLKTTGVWGSLWFMPTATLFVLLGSQNIFTIMAVFFTKASLVTFGGAYAVLTYVAQQAVENHHWVSAQQMVDGLGLAETTPGPLVIALQFVGFVGAYTGATGLSPLLSGVLGGLLTSWVTFTPCFLWVFAGAPYVEQIRNNATLNEVLSNVSAAVVGVLCNLAAWMIFHTLFEHFIPIDVAGHKFDLPSPESINLFGTCLTAVAGVAVFKLRMPLLLVLPVSAAIAALAGA